MCAGVTAHVGGMGMAVQDWQQSWALALESGLPWSSHPVDMRLILFSCDCSQCPTGAWEHMGHGIARTSMFRTLHCGHVAAGPDRHTLSMRHPCCSSLQLSQLELCFLFLVTPRCPLGALWNLAPILSIWNTVALSPKGRSQHRVEATMGFPQAAWRGGPAVLGTAIVFTRGI